MLINEESSILVIGTRTQTLYCVPHKDYPLFLAKIDNIRLHFINELIIYRARPYSTSQEIYARLVLCCGFMRFASRGPVTNMDPQLHPL